MPLHSTIAFDKLHKAKFNAGLAIDKPLAPEGSGDIYFSSDTQILSIADADGLLWVDYDLSNIGGGGGGTINDLSDVTIVSPLNNQVLTYDSVDGRWENKTPQLPATDLNDLDDVQATSVANGSLLVNINGIWYDLPPGNTGEYLQFNSSLFFDMEWVDLIIPAVDFDVILTDANGDVLVDAQGNILHL